MTTTEAARIAGCHPETVRKALKTGRLAGARDSYGQWIVQRDALRRWASRLQGRALKPQSTADLALEALAGLQEPSPNPTIAQIATRAGLSVATLRPGTAARYALEAAGWTAPPRGRPKRS